MDSHWVYFWAEKRKQTELTRALSLWERSQWTEHPVAAQRMQVKALLEDVRSVTSLVTPVSIKLKHKPGKVILLYEKYHNCWGWRKYWLLQQNQETMDTRILSLRSTWILRIFMGFQSDQKVLYVSGVAIWTFYGMHAMCLQNYCGIDFLNSSHVPITVSMVSWLSLQPLSICCRWDRGRAGEP